VNNNKKIELITWIDSASIGGEMWIDPDQIDPDCMTEQGLSQQSIGFIFKESPDVVLILQSIGSDRVGAALAIPKKAILNRIPLEKVKAYDSK